MFITDISQMVESLNRVIRVLGRYCYQVQVVGVSPNLRYQYFEYRCMRYCTVVLFTDASQTQ